MAETATKLPVKTEGRSRAPAAPQAWRPFDSLRNEIDRLFEDFGGGFFSSPFRRSLFETEPFRGRETGWGTLPAVDIVETEKAYEITAELPGMDEKNIEVTLSNSGLVIRGEKQEEKEETKKDYYLRERQMGSFERYFGMPEGVDTNKIEAAFNKGVLKITLPKTAEAQKAETKIAIKAA